MSAVPKYQCQGKCAITAKPDQYTLDTLEIGFRNLFESDSPSLLKKYLTRTIFDKLKLKKTSFGSTFLDCIKSGLTHHDSGIGIYAPDPEAYTTFAEIFDPIIEDYHNGFKSTDIHPERDVGNGSTIGNIDPTGKYVVSVRIRVGRSVKGYPFNPRLTEDQYTDLQKKICIVLAGLTGDLSGVYYPIYGMDPDVQKRLIDQHYLFKQGDRFLEAANANRFWPIGRGIYFNEDKTFLVWLNEEDHMRIISMEYGGNLGAVYRRLINGLSEIEKKIEIVIHPRLGFVSSCPTNLGTSIRASVHIKIPKLAKKREKLDAAVKKYNLQIRGTAGEHSDSKDGVYDISNKQRLGITEYEAVKILETGVKEIIKLENSIKVKKKPPPTEMELARRRLRKNPKLERLKWPKFLPYFLYKI